MNVFYFQFFRFDLIFKFILVDTNGAYTNKTSFCTFLYPDECVNSKISVNIRLLLYITLFELYLDD